MVEQLYHNPDIYRIYVPLPDNPLKYLNCYVLVSDAETLIIDTGFNRPESKQARFYGLDHMKVDNAHTKLFLTHLHGDHIYGLPSVVLGISFDQSPDGPISLYGPPGLGEYLSTSFRVCESKIACDLNIFELCFPNQSCSRMRLDEHDR